MESGAGTHGHGMMYRRPNWVDFVAGLLLLAAVVLHVVAMVPSYFDAPGSSQSILAQPDQAALYSVLAAAWALALVVGLTGPARIPLCAALAVGVAATELGFRISDLGTVFRYGYSQAGAGLWIMTAAWVVGATGAGVAVVAARRQSISAFSVSPALVGRLGASGGSDPAAPFRPQLPAGDQAPGWPQVESFQPQLPAAAPPPAWPEPHGLAPQPYGVGTPQQYPVPAQPSYPAIQPYTAAPPAGVPLQMPTQQTALQVPSSPQSHPAEGDPAIGTREGWIVGVAILALTVAGAFLPPWDHYVVVSSVTGQTATRNLGNAFSGPWQIVIGNVVVAVALVVVAFIGITRRNRHVGAAAIAGSLIVLASQFVAAVIQVDQKVLPSQLGISAGDASDLGLTISLRLTGWFVLDAVAAFALLAAAMVWATLRVVQENSPGTLPRAPEARSDAMPWVS